MRAAIYARKSTDQSGVSDNQKSVARQIDSARAFITAKGWSIDDAHVHSDDAKSGADVGRLRDRGRLMAAVDGGPPLQALVMRDASRFSRRDGDESFGELKRLAQAGVEIWFARMAPRSSSAASPPTSPAWCTPKSMQAITGRSRVAARMKLWPRKQELGM